MSGTAPGAIGLDFGTTTVVARSDGSDRAELIDFAGEGSSGPVFRSALCFWEEEGAWNGIAH